MVASATSSSWLESPSIKLGTWASSRDSAKTCYAAAETVCGKHVKAQFKNYGSLPSSFSTATRNVEIWLMEKDGNDVNDDDAVKRYTSTIYWRSMLSVVWDNTYTAGNGEIEGAGDNSAELYIKYYIPSKTGDPQDPRIASGLFDYMLVAN